MLNKQKRLNKLNKPWFLDDYVEKRLRVMIRLLQKKKKNETEQYRSLSFLVLIESRSVSIFLKE